ncbi:DUF2062 domain-containing protein [Mesobaculum littorinae]|uniref:DUF2062 domain-containing protein n=1 Tax=Mesobaculum littorinae TaxID=2486419 RepID=A0A438AFK4_9RHOB|nr:DUF2062 domain-containing protein [Mesobaculum littorinae]RVV97486.1 DUF2062 domain-containing protein [Mesobaculum littorinae]
MVFKRRPQPWLNRLGRFIYPRGGWIRAVRYVVYRLRRLPDPAHKISRGIACGIFVCFTPFFGLHFLISGGMAWLIRGNVLAALMATFFGNPLTFPIIAAMSVELGAKILDTGHAVPLHQVFGAFGQASAELWANLRAVFTSDPTHWGRLDDFFSGVFLPYLVGGLVPGLIAAVVSYAVTRPVIAAYQKARIGRLKKSFAARRAKAQAAKAD